ncbi:hypothetical protein D3C81_1448990 [compost metagenome]
MPKFIKNAKDSIKWNNAQEIVTKEKALYPQDGKVYWDKVLESYKELGGKFVELKYNDFK